VNAALLHRIADRIEAHPAQYDQATFGLQPDRTVSGPAHRTCKAPCCVAGWACLLSGDPDAFYCETTEEVGDHAAALLGLTPRQKDRLFDSLWSTEWMAADEDLLDYEAYDGEYFRPTAAQAADVLRRLARKELVL